MYYLDLDDIGYDPVLIEIQRLFDTRNYDDLPLFLSYLHPSDLVYIVTRINNYIPDGNIRYTLSYDERDKLLRLFCHVTKDVDRQRQNRRLYYSKEQRMFYYKTYPTKDGLIT